MFKKIVIYKSFYMQNYLYSIFSNLWLYAILYSGVGATISIRVEPDKNQGLIVSIIDTGPGISAEHLPHLTERFYRVDTSRASNTGGTGLGLAIVKHALLRHGARLTVQSVLGQGSTFSCWFPRERVWREEP